LIISPSQRLNYRLMTINDAELLFDVDQDANVMKFINGGKQTSMKDIQQIMLPRLQKYLNLDKGWGIWQVNRNETQEYIGWILVRPMGFFSEAPMLDNLELGWRFKAHTWGKGYATEAAGHVMSALSVEDSIRLFSAIAVPSNHGSINVMRKIGMYYVHTGIHKDPLGDTYMDYYSCKNA
jgi:RimJ/RimL family protein N-acetyltransferase